MIGQLKQAQARQLVYKHTIFLHAWDIQTWHETSLDSFYMIGQLKQAQARQLVYKHTIFLCARDYISGFIQARTFKLGLKHL